jgi:hypothetical protein
MTNTVTAPTAPDPAELTACIAGAVHLPGTPGYTQLGTPWNGASTAGIVAVVEVATAQDVVQAVRFAARHHIEVGVQCTGHGSAGFDRPTLLVHTAGLDDLAISPDGSARVGAGIRWGQLLEAAAPMGLAGLAGSAPDVGVVGYLTGGGLGPVARTFGFASDQVTAFDVVTGDGYLRRATATENPAIFWALRGGKGALGIVTAVEFDLIELPEMYGGALYFDGADAATVLHAWRRWAGTLPEQATTSVAVLRLPDLPMVPPPLAGRVTVAVRFAWVGDPATGEHIVAPMRAVAPVVLGGVGVLPYSALGSIHADPVDPMPVHEHAQLLTELTDEAVDTLLALAGPAATCPQVIVELRQLGGAIARAPRHASAVCHRDAAFTLLTIGLSIPPLIEATDAHGRQLMSAMSPWSTGANLPNFAASADPRQVARNYDAATLSRLGSLARSYDPQSIIAAAAVVRAATAEHA